jgi:cyclic beta-1,2-glucan synthetase
MRTVLEPLYSLVTAQSVAQNQSVFKLLRVEQLTEANLCRYAEDLARNSSTQAPEISRNYLLKRLKLNARALEHIYFTLSAAAEQKPLLPPGSDWYLDNFHIIENHTREIIKSLPRGYQRKLPCIAEGVYSGAPRAFMLAREYLLHRDSTIERTSLSAFIGAYQKVSALSIGELWAVPIFLRLTLVEHLRQLGDVCLARLENADLAESILSTVVTTEQTGTDLVLSLASKLEYPKLDFEELAVPILRKLRTYGIRTAAAVHWLEERLKERGSDIEELIRRDQGTRAADQITIGNCISSLRAVDALEWREWFEDMAMVDRILMHDPAQAYNKCDFETRDRIRHQIESLARRAVCTELQVSETIMTLCQRENISEHERHVGFYTLDQGRLLLEQELKVDGQFLARASRLIQSNRCVLFFSCLAFLSASLLFIPTRWLLAESPTIGVLLAFIALFLVLASDIALQMLQWIASHLFRPSFLAKFDYSKGIPAEHHTIVTVHGIFKDKDTLTQFVEGIEVRYLANDDAHLDFVLLADLFDADSEHTDSDAELIEHARQLIEGLNASSEHRPFHLFFRRRQFSQTEKRWMARERKRGKIHEFNQFILGDDTTSLQAIVANTDRLRQAKFVITLDADTGLPRGSAHKLVGTLAHPLNKAVFHPDNSIERGYCIVQPRITTSLTSAHLSWFSWIYSGQTGLDPYTSLISNFYQDLFGRASYLGKGIYDVGAFERSLANRIPDSALLSHDLFESCYARTGLASDIEFIDDFPSRYNSFARREHRWVRGDWQLTPWLRSLVPTAQGKVPNSLDALSLWKLADNLRRSLVPPAAFCLLLASFSILPGASVSWALLVLATLILPIALGIANSVVAPPRNVSVGRYSRNLFGDSVRHLSKALIALTMLPYQAFMMGHAISITLWRVFVSKRHMLEWESAYYAEKRLGNSSLHFMLEMAGGLCLTVVTATVIAWYFPDRFPAFLPLVMLWLSSPIAAAVLSKSISRNTFAPNNEEQSYLRSVAFQTWCFFDDLLIPAHNFLIPDNIQLAPSTVLALRTSPTNIGLSLLACMTGNDLGFCTLPHTLLTLDKIVENLARLESWNGHLLNWYDVQSLAPLAPRYISAVDSGNYVANLMLLEEYLYEIESLELWSAHHNLHFKEMLAVLAADGSSDASQLLQELEAQPLNIHTLAALTTSNKLLVSAPTKAQLHLNHKSSPVQRAQSFLAQVAALAPYLTLVDKTPSADPILLASSHLKLGDVLLCAQAHTNAGEHQAGINALQSLISQALRTREQVSKFLQEVDFEPLYDHGRDAFAIGINLDIARRDPNHYDLLASEARLTSFITIARGEVPQRHWFKLGRGLTDTPGGRALLSWSGTMFEYLMPLLVLKDFPGTLLANTNRAIVKAQERYAAQRGVPWGISESAYAGVDFHKTYQYKAFGVPGLGFKRGLSDDLVVAPYATFLALMVDPGEALRNIHALEADGLRGEYGFYEAIDYTAARLTVEEKGHVVKSFLAHHQGMSLVAINNVLNANIMQERFHRIPEVKTAELLLQERFPLTAPTLVPHRGERRFPEDEALRVSRSTVDTNPYTAVPRTMLLSNGRYSVVVDQAGAGYSYMDRELMLTRFREDAISTPWGQFVLLRDAETGAKWSAGFQPMRADSESYRVTFDPAKVELWRREEGIVTHNDITVSPDQNFEVRRVQVSNTTSKLRRIEITSYAEVALASVGADLSHPAFSKMFIQTDYVPELEVILCERRPRSRKEESIFLFHSIVMPVCFAETQFETSRPDFLGRGRTLGLAQALDTKLGAHSGPVLDPCISLRTRLDIDPGITHEVSFVTGFARTREEALQIASRLREGGAIDRVFHLAASYADVELRHQQFSVSQMLAFQKLANALFYMVAEWRAPAHTLSRNTLGQSALWRFGISGDLPVVLLRIGDADQIGLAQELVLAHEYLRIRGVVFDLVVLNEYPGGYFRNLHEELEFVMRAGGNGAFMEQRGGLFLRSASQLSEEELTLLETVARVLLHGSKGSLAEQLKFKDEGPARRRRKPMALPAAEPSKKLLNNKQREFDNGIGGFVEAGSVYEMIVRGDELPPLPWSNVIANKDFGAVITESGGGYTWSQNSREYRLTPWSNDPVSDTRGEAIYIRDTVSGSVWSPTPLPVRNEDTYKVSHGFGWSSFATEAQDVESELTVSVSLDKNVKWWHLKLKNPGRTQRKLELYLYCEWVLGVTRDQSHRFLVPSFDERANLLLARNPWANEFAGRVVGIGSNLDIQSYTSSRLEFIGRHHGLAAPESINGKSGSLKFSSKNSVGLETCAVIQISINLKPDEEREIAFYLAEGANLDEVRSGASYARSLSNYHENLSATKNYWRSKVQAIQVKTPDPTFNVLMNGWLLYQTLACRILARSAFYQSGGAFGFRDQLQDSLAFLAIDPELPRKQILLHASRQFVEGDVQHWWHPPSGRGTRTKFSDDFLWLPYAVSRYVETTGDVGLLDTEAPFIEAALLEENQHETYLHPKESTQRASIFEHCIRAVEHGMTAGPHGLPLMGVGDWNDGMNEIGIHGKGESVWVGWFQIEVLNRFIPLCKTKKRDDLVRRYEARISQLKAAIEQHAWDGEWYKRAFFDDGSPLGSKQNQDCQIDSISQSWAVISGAGDPVRSAQGMQSAQRILVDDKNRILKLLYPPFDKGAEQPGYIKGYLPGLRENGGQYTHAAAWFIMATAMLGDGELAFKYFKLINPVDITSSGFGLSRYRGEPYAMAGDVYSNPALEGHVGWSWYTGSSGWLYQVGLHSLLGINIENKHLSISPCIPPGWREFSLRWSHAKAHFNITVKNPHGLTTAKTSVTANGEICPNNQLSLDKYFGDVEVVAEMLRD